MRLRRFPEVAAVLCLLWSIPAGADIDKGPYLLNVTKTSIEVVWQEASPGEIDWGATPDYGNTEASEYNPATGMHHAYLTQLSPATFYYYRVRCGGFTQTGTFVTAPERSTPFVFAVSGDTRSNHADHQTMTDRIIADGIPDMYFNTGDLVEDGASADDWAAFFQIEAELMKNSVFWPVMGNHDFALLTLFDRWFSTGRSYSFTYGNSIFIVMNTDGIYGQGSGQYNMVKSELQRAANDATIQFKFVLFHKPGVTSGSHDPDQNIVKYYLDLFEQYNVDVVFNGHNHIYEHGLVNGVHYLVTGGGGVGVSTTFELRDWTVYVESVHHYCRVEVQPDHYSVQVIDINGDVIDSFDQTDKNGGYPGPTPEDLITGGCGASCQDPHAPDKDDAPVTLAIMLAPVVFVMFRRARVLGPGRKLDLTDKVLINRKPGETGC